MRAARSLSARCSPRHHAAAWSPLPQAGEDRKGIPLAPLPNPATYPAFKSRRILSHSRHSRGPDAGSDGEAVGEGHLFIGDGNSAAGPATLVPPEPGPHAKADRDGRPLGHLSTFSVQRPPVTRVTATPQGRAARSAAWCSTYRVGMCAAPCYLRSARAWWNGRHTGLKIRRGYPRAGSSPAARTSREWMGAERACGG